MNYQNLEHLKTFLIITKVEFAICLLFQDPWQITWLICWNIFSDILSHFRSAITLGIHHQVIIGYLPATINGKTSSARKVFMLFWSFWAEVNCYNIAFWCRINPNRPQAISQFKNFYLTISRKYPQLNPAPSGGLLFNFQDWKKIENCWCPQLRIKRLNDNNFTASMTTARWQFLSNIILSNPARSWTRSQDWLTVRLGTGLG